LAKIVLKSILLLENAGIQVMEQLQIGICGAGWA